MELYNLEKLIVEQNPQWIANSKESIGHKRDNFADFCHELIKKKLIITLSGPRRVGKTFLLKQSINWLIETKQVKAQNILYFQFSGSQNDKNIIHQIIDLFLTKYSDNKPKYIFFDEVQYIDYWQDHIKQAYDLQKDIKFVVSGSSTLFYHQKSRESLAGRILKLKLGVLNFTEYLRFKGLPIPSKNRAKYISKLTLYQTEFRKYLSQGQYPELVTNPDLDPPKYIADLADQIINFDIPYFSAKIDRQLFWSLVKTLSHDLADEYSANNLAKILDSDRRTIGQYVKILEEVNLFSVCYNYGFKSMRKKLSSSKKIYSLSLNLSLHLGGFHESYLDDSRVFGKYFENYIFMRLLSTYQLVEYYRIKGNELDFVTDHDAYEIKSNQADNAVKYLDLSQKLKKSFHLITPEDGYLL